MDEILEMPVREEPVQTGLTHRIGPKEVQEALKILHDYKEGKTNLENRVVKDELWYKLRHWEIIRRKEEREKPQLRGPEPASAWLFNAIMNKHADAMDNYPEPVVLPREPSDDETAKVLSSVLPVIMENAHFEDTYSAAWWDKLKHGTSVYGIFWDSEKDNGIGDIDIHQIDLLKLFWEPGITDIQDSRNMFILDMVDTDLLEEAYPQYKGKLSGQSVNIQEYIFDDDVNTDDKSVVVDWYYKVKGEDGRTILHYCKFCNDCVLFATENTPELAERGYYDHGMYPVVFDTLFPEQGTPVGFGYVAICKDPQIYIDKLNAHIMESSLIGTKTRYLVSDTTNINEDDLKDIEKPTVRVEGSISNDRVQQMVVQPISQVYLQVQQQRIEEMKDTVGNRDVNSGQAGAGVTAAAAIAALQEAGNKTSRDMIAASYRAHNKICWFILELMRQFYQEQRVFRITLPNGAYDFAAISNASMLDQTSEGPMGEIFVRKPIFDLKIKAQKKNPFSRMELNELAKELYSMGFFDPNRAQEAMLALNMMSFEGIEKVREQVEEGQTLMNIVQQMSQQMDQMAAIIQALTGKDMGLGMQPAAAPAAGAPQEKKPSAPMTDSVMQAQTPMTGYGQRLAERSKPDVAVTKDLTK